MKTKTRKAYVSLDGRSFNTQKECRAWEDQLLYCDPVHLTTEQIIGLMKAAFHGPFLLVPRESRTEISLFVRLSSQEDTDFDFYFSYIEDEKELRVFDGSVRYRRERDILLRLGLEENEEFRISPDWKHWSDFSVRRVYNYLQSVGYFTRRKEKPEINPLFLKEGWHKIYSQDYRIAGVGLLRTMMHP